MLRPRPPRIISRIVSLSEPKTIVFGGVAAGSMKAKDAEIVTGKRIISGCNSRLDVIGAKKFNRSIVEAVLEVNSVKKVVNKQRLRINRKGGSPAKPSNWEDISLPSPELSIPLANAKPPPKRKMGHHH